MSHGTKVVPVRACSLEGIPSQERMQVVDLRCNMLARKQVGRRKAPSESLNQPGKSSNAELLPDCLNHFTSVFWGEFHISASR
jgi:hypothetical protein